MKMSIKETDNIKTDKYKFTKEDSKKAKGFAILLLIFYHLFNDINILEKFAVDFRPIPENLFLIFAGFGNICVAIFVSITAYGITEEVTKTDDLRKSMDKACSRFGKLMLQFLVMFLFVITIWFYKFNLVGLYGDGKQGFIYGIIDALGLAESFNTPTLNMTWWYMDLAYLLILIVPILAFIYRYIGKSMLLLAMFLPQFLSMGDSLDKYLFVAVFAIIIYKKNIYERIFNGKISRVMTNILSIIIFILSIFIRQNYVIYNEFVYIIDAVIAWNIIYLSSVIIGNIPVIKQSLLFLGKFSMSIFLIHTFIYQSLYQGFIYKFKYAIISYLLVLAISLILSIVLEFIKKIVSKVIHINT